MNFFYFEGRKDDYEYKNIVNTKTPFHQIGT